MLCFSIYSDISIEWKWSSESNSVAASVSQFVFPTPVGPRNKNDPIGFDGSLIPERARHTASVTSCTASSCPITRSSSVSRRRNSLSRSPSTSFVTGMPVHLATIVAISLQMLASRSNRLSLPSSKGASSSCNCFSSAGIFPY